jgi:hypothetical protein
MKDKKLITGIGVWAEKDIENTLRGVDVANLDVATIVPTPEMQIYRRGYAAAISAMSVAFGLNYRSQPAEPAKTLAPTKRSHRNLSPSWQR